MTFLSPNQQCQSTEGKNITFHGLAYPKLTWGLPTLSLTTNSSWLPWGMVAMPLISPLMPVLQLKLSINFCFESLLKTATNCCQTEWQVQPVNRMALLLVLFWGNVQILK